jgi:hypothetical protein
VVASMIFEATCSFASFDLINRTVDEALQGATNLVFINRDSCGFKIAHHLVDDVTVSGFLEVNYDHGICIGFGVAPGLSS